jgi:hypothetical protein
VRCGRISGLGGELFWGWFLGHISRSAPLPQLETTHKAQDWPNPLRASLFLAAGRRSSPCYTSERGHGPALLSRPQLPLKSDLQKKNIHRRRRCRVSSSAVDNVSCMPAAVSEFGHETRQILQHTHHTTKLPDILSTKIANHQRMT